MERTEKISNINNLKIRLESGKMLGARNLINNLHPSELARLIESLPLKERAIIWELIELKNKGDVVKLENWGLMNLSYLIKKNRKGNYIHFKIKANGKILSELEKNEKIDRNLLRYLTVKVKKFDLETDYFKKSDEKELEKFQKNKYEKKK